MAFDLTGLLNFKGFLGLILLVVWIAGLWFLSKSKKEGRIGVFYAVFLIPIAFALLMNFGLVLSTLAATTLITAVVAVIASTLYILLWGFTLYEVGGEDELIWFIFIAIFNPLWIFYRLTKIA